MVTIDRLTKNYDDFSLDVSLQIREGHVTGIIGRNGAGKSTTIKAILGLIRPDGGSVKVFGKPVQELTTEDRQMIGAAMAESCFSSYLNAADVAAIMKHMYKAFDSRKFLQACRAQGIAEKKPIRDYSTGMKAKLRVLIALSHEAKFLILDEPTAGLDIEARDEILDILRNYLAEDEQRAVLVTSHIASDLEGLCDDVYLIDKGRVELHEDTDVILSDYAVLKVAAEDYEKLDRTYMIKARKESFGYTCLVKEKQYYIDNYPGLVIENSGIDDLIRILTGGR